MLAGGGRAAMLDGPPPQLVATKSFRHRDRYGTHDVDAGVTRLSPNHDWLLDENVRGHFAPLTSAAGKDAIRRAGKSSTTTRTATATVARKPATPAPVRRDTGGGRVAVRIVPEAVSDIRNSVFWRNAGRDQHNEVGGWLTGAWDGRDLWITGATEAVRQATPTSLKLDLAKIDGLKLGERWGRNLGVVGAFHLHPSGGLLPSRADYQQLEEMFEWLEDTATLQPYAVSLIVGSNQRSLTDLSADVWVCCRENGGFVSEPGRLVLEAA